MVVWVLAGRRVAEGWMGGMVVGGCEEPSRAWSSRRDSGWR